jgi:hypothetical protein
MWTEEQMQRMRVLLGELWWSGHCRSNDRSLRTWLLSAVDKWLLLGYWWFRPFPYERHNSDGSLYERFTVRRTLAGYLIPWGLYTQFYEDGRTATEGLTYRDPFSCGIQFRMCKYWLPDGTKVSQAEWMRFQFGPGVEECVDPAWEQ